MEEQKRNRKLTILAIIIAIVIVVSIFYFVILADDKDEIYNNKLIYLPEQSNVDAGVVAYEYEYFDDVLFNIQEVEILVYDLDDYRVDENCSITWEHINSDNYNITNGDIVTIEYPNKDISGFRIVMAFNGAIMVGPIVYVP